MPVTILPGRRLRRVGVWLVGALLATATPADADLERCTTVKRKAMRAGLTVPRKPGALVRKLASRNATRADLAYCRLAGLGATAVDALLAADVPETPFAGTAWSNPASSRVIAPPSQGLVALYLVEGVLRSDDADRRLAPRLVPLLIHAAIKDQATLLAMALPLYRTWWAGHRATPLATLRAAGEHPLRDTPISWL